MALFNPGPTVGQISGRIGGSVYSHNRGGAYIRNGTIPTKSTTAYAMTAKQTLQAASMAWQSIAAASQQAWAAWAQQNPITNRLGNKSTLSGHQAYVGNYCRIIRAGGTPLTLPPIDPAPDALLTSALTLDIGAGAFQIAYTTTPTGATEHLWLNACVVSSAGISFIQNLLKTIVVTAAAQASPYDFEADLVARFGTLQVGEVITVDAMVFDNATGLLSAPLRASGTVVST